MGYHQSLPVTVGTIGFLWTVMSTCRHRHREDSTHINITKTGIPKYLKLDYILSWALPHDGSMQGQLMETGLHNAGLSSRMHHIHGSCIHLPNFWKPIPYPQEGLRGSCHFRYPPHQRRHQRANRIPPCHQHVQTQVPRVQRTVELRSPMESEHVKCAKECYLCYLTTQTASDRFQWSLKYGFHVDQAQAVEVHACYS